MAKLGGVPYVQQHCEGACGAAALAMALGAHGVEVDPKEMFERLGKEDPYHPGEKHIEIRDLIAETKGRGLYAAAGGISTSDSERMVNDLGWFASKGAVVIVAQHFSETSTFTHFRVVLGIEDDDVIVHDPHETGGPEIRYNKADFLKLWAPRDKLAPVGGAGACFYVADTELSELKKPPN